MELHPLYSPSKAFVGDKRARPETDDVVAVELDDVESMIREEVLQQLQVRAKTKNFAFLIFIFFNSFVNRERSSSVHVGSLLNLQTCSTHMFFLARIADLKNALNALLWPWKSARNHRAVNHVPWLAHLAFAS